MCLVLSCIDSIHIFNYLLGFCPKFYLLRFTKLPLRDSSVFMIGMGLEMWHKKQLLVEPTGYGDDRFFENL